MSVGMRWCVMRWRIDLLRFKKQAPFEKGGRRALLCTAGGFKLLQLQRLKRNNNAMQIQILLDLA